MEVLFHFVARRELQVDQWQKVWDGGRWLAPPRSGHSLKSLQGAHNGGWRQDLNSQAFA